LTLGFRRFYANPQVKKKVFNLVLVKNNYFVQNKVVVFYFPPALSQQ